MDFSNSHDPSGSSVPVDGFGSPALPGMPYNWGDKIKKPAQPPDGFVPAGERKEAAPAKKEKVFKEKVPIVERTPPKEVGPEVKDWMERLETGEEIQLPQPVTDDTTGQVLVAPPVPEKVEIKLPLTEAEIQRGLHHEIIESIRWLAEWCRRLLKIASKKFIYQIKGRGEK